MSSSNVTRLNQEWLLPMPSGISFTDNTFTTDLLKQFDKRRSKLNSSDISIRQESFDNNSNHTTTSSHRRVASSSSVHNNSRNSIPIEQVRDNNNIRRSSLSSSVSTFHYNIQQIEQPRASKIFNSWTLKKKKKFHNNNNNRHVQEIFNEPLSNNNNNNNNNTLSIPPSLHHQHHQYDNNNMIQTPIITQYPPKPLKYSPVEPLPDTSAVDHSRNTLKRLSLPLLKLTAATQQQQQQQQSLHRRRSDSDLLNQQQSNKTFFCSLSKRWNKLLLNYKNKRIRNKRNA
ncbi:hypothetical protein BD770DRAFT_164820 [Pilaira anomala]|nr:hypothetical protein BD770DRAFT_164820 [Pilaira anomala]